jgi:hypothetical protein
MKMDPFPDLDRLSSRAVETATTHLHAAQEKLASSLSIGRLPSVPAADKVMHRAEDLHDLAQQATEDEPEMPLKPGWGGEPGAPKHGPPSDVVNDDDGNPRWIGGPAGAEWVTAGAANKH